jgi:hypothetical protein
MSEAYRLTDLRMLMWFHDRLTEVYKESPNVDYMHRLRAIIATVEPTKVSIEEVSYEDLQVRMIVGEEKLRKAERMLNANAI